MGTLDAVREHFEFDENQKDLPIRLRGDRRTHLLRIFRSAGFKIGAEIGVWEGDYSRSMFRYMPDLHLFCIDPWKAYGDFHEDCNEQDLMDAAYQKTLENTAGKDVEILRGESLEYAPSIPDGSLDFVFIDGNHNLPYSIADLHAWTPKVRKGGIVSGHDYLVKRYPPADIHVKLAVNAWTDAYMIRPWFILTQSRWPTWFWVKE